jgi:hypothetical protein
MTNARGWPVSAAGRSFISGPSPTAPARPAGSAGWAADFESAGARRGVQLALGAIWLLDAALQYQPHMFSRAFVTQQIDPAAAGSPGFVSGPVTLAGHVILHSPVAFDALFATIQLAIGLGLLWRRTARAALAGSIIWALSIWWLGEGLGGIFTGSASPVTGAPGAAVLCALISVLAWPSGARLLSGGNVASDSRLGEHWARSAWLVVWGSGACFLLMASNQAPGALRGQVTSAAAGEPGWIAGLDRRAATVIGSHGTEVSLLLAVVFAVIALGVLVPATTRPALLLAVITAAAIWLVGESLGGMLTGQGTDPNTGPLLILLAAAYWPLPRAGRRPSWPSAAAASGRHRGTPVSRHPGGQGNLQNLADQGSRSRSGPTGVTPDLDRL